jgi:hypothetical protein
VSYARKGPESSVYVFMDYLGLYECCICDLAVRTESPHGPRWADPAPMLKEDILAHLQKHRDAGGKVPDDCIESIREES